MFKACFKNFFSNLKYVFVEIGFMYLFLLFGFDVFFRQLGIGFDQLKEAFSQLLETGNFDMIEKGFEELLTGITGGAAGFIAIQVLGLLLGFILMMIMMRKEVEKRNIFKVLLSAIVDALILAAFIAIVVLITSAAEWGGIVVILIFLPLYSIMTLFGSYVNHGMKAVQFKKAVSFRNMFKLAICNFFIILLTLGIGALCGLIFNVIIGLTAIVALFMVGICVISLNADSFVVSLVENAKVDEKIEKAKQEIANKKEEIKDEPKEEKIEAKEKKIAEPKEAEPKSAK